LWCFLQCMFTKALEIPFTLNFPIADWADHNEFELAKVRRDFSRWLNSILIFRIVVGEKPFYNEKMKDPKHKPTVQQPEIRKKFYDLLS
jgi:hypothetical protein